MERDHHVSEKFLHSEQLARTLSKKGIRDQRILEAIRSTDRSRFLPREAARRAGRDRPVPLPRRQVTTQPYRIARMLEALALEGQERLLEVGTGYGYATALCALLVRRVVTVERLVDLQETARRNLAARENVLLVLGDGSLGYPPEAPYDAILVSASAPSPPPPFFEQLKPGGRLVLPLSLPGRGEVVLYRRTNSILERIGVVFSGRFVPLVGHHGAVRPTGRAGL